MSHLIDEAVDPAASTADAEAKVCLPCLISVAFLLVFNVSEQEKAPHKPHVTRSTSEVTTRKELFVSARRRLFVACVCCVCLLLSLDSYSSLQGEEGVFCRRFVF